MADLKDLGSAPGLSSEIKATQIDTENCFLNDSWSYLTFDLTCEFSLSSCSSPVGHPHDKLGFSFAA